MATLREAERAREEASMLLLELGAHAISVEEDAGGEQSATRTAGVGPDALGEPSPGADPDAGASAALDGQPEWLARPDAAGEVVSARGARARRRRRSFAIVAWFADEPPADLPDRVEVRAGSRTASVPVRARRVERFRPEQDR